MQGRFFEEFDVEDEILTGERTVTDEDVRAFARVSAVATGLVADTRLTRGTLIAFLGLEWSFRAPLRPGDSVRARLRVAETRPTSRPDRGLVRLAVDLLGAGDAVVQQGTWALLVRRRGGG